MGCTPSSSGAGQQASLSAPNSLLPSGKTDAFLAHSWANGNHERVAEVNKGLQRRGVRTWFDSDRMAGQIRKTMAEGIENTKCAVVFVTEAYRDKVNGHDMRDNCQYEFTYAVQQLGPQKMIPVVMEKGMRDPRGWKGQLGGELGSLLYIDFSDVDEGSAAWEARLGELVKRIEAVVGALSLPEAVPEMDSALTATLSSTSMQVDANGTQSSSGNKFKNRKSITTLSNPIATDATSTKAKSPRLTSLSFEQLASIAADLGISTVESAKAAGKTKNRTKADIIRDIEALDKPTIVAPPSSSDDHLSLPSGWDRASPPTPVRMGPSIRAEVKIE